MGGSRRGNFGNTNGSRSFLDRLSDILTAASEKSGLQIRFDKGEKNATGFKGKDHYHILNPNSTGKHDHYLDINGNPVAKNSKASHIIP